MRLLASICVGTADYSSYTLAYRLPSGSQIGGLVVWNGDAEDDFDGQKTEIVFTP
jgi:hypothetical protein